MSQEDKARLDNKGYGDVLKGPSANILSDNSQYKFSLNDEMQDIMTKNTISFQFVGYKTPRESKVNKIPKRFYMVMRFFTFCEVVTDYQTLDLGED
jgi:hypothetical protein